MELNRKLIWFLMFVGGVAGGFVPLLWGGDGFSFASVIFTGLGGLAGVWLGFKLSQ